MKTVSALSLIAASLLSAMHAACERPSTLSAPNQTRTPATASAPATPAKTGDAAKAPADSPSNRGTEHAGNGKPALPAHLFM